MAFVGALSQIQMPSGAYTPPKQGINFFQHSPQIKQPQMPGFTQPYPFHTPQSQPTLSQRLGQMLSGDEILNAQKTALNDQLRSGYATGTLEPIKQALINLGGAPSGLDLSKYASPTDLSGKSVGPSLAEALSDPGLADAAHNNPYSMLAKITQALNEANMGASNSAAARGLVDSSELTGNATTNLNAANEGRYGAENSFLTTMRDSYNNYLHSLTSAQGTFGGYQQDTLDRATQLINQGIIGAPAKPHVSSPYSAPAKTSPKKAAPFTNPRSGQVARNSY